MIHTLIFGGLVTAIGGLWWLAEATTPEPGSLRPRDVLAAPVRAARWALASHRWQTALRADLQELATATAMLSWTAPQAGAAGPARPEPAWYAARPLGLTGSCPSCEAVRCRAWWEGRDCRWEGEHDRPVYAAGRPLPRPGRHSVAVRVAAYRRRVQLAYRRQAVLLDPAWYAFKLGRPVQLAGPVRRLP